MYVALPHCSMKCNIDSGKTICQNTSLKDSSCINFDGDTLIKRYLNNPLTHAIVFGGLEPFDSHFDLIAFISALRNKYNCNDDVVIYTGYTEDELEGKSLYSYPNCTLQSVLVDVYKELKNYNNIIIKFGRYKEGDEPHYDEVLGINLASDNQHAKVI